jgi:hypothetical protein
MFVTAMSIAIADKTPAGNRWENPWNFAQNRLRVSAAPNRSPCTFRPRYLAADPALLLALLLGAG